MITKKEHGYLDYFYGVFLIILPFLLNFPSGTVTIFPIVMGIILLIQSVLTDYELGLLKIIPFKIHLGVDIIAGFLILSSPWLLDFAGTSILPFVLMGMFSVIVSFFTALRNPKKKKKTKTKYPQNEFIDPPSKRPTSNEMEESLNSEV